MARTPTNAPKPVRPLAVLAVGLVVMFGIMALTGTWSPRLGLDLQGGTSITLTANTPDGGEPSPESMDQAIEIIRQRVDGAGAAEAEVSIQGSNNIVVQVPGVGEDELVRLVGQTAELRFRPVLQVLPGSQPAPAPSAPGDPAVPTDPAATPTAPADPAATPSAPADPAATPDATLEPDPAASTPPAGRALTEGLQSGAAPTPTPAPSGSASPPADAEGGATPAPTALQPPGDDSGTPTPEQLAALESFDCASIVDGALDDETLPLVTCDREGTTRFLLGPADVVGTDLDDATAGIPQGQVAWQVNLSFTSEGADKFYDSTVELSSKTPPQNSFAIVLDGRVVSYPSVENPIPGGEAQITGDFTQAEAQDLANVLKYGALPLTFTTSEVTTVTPALGSESLRAGIIAGAVGLALVVVYSLLFYRALGLVSILSLGVAGLLTYGSVVLLGEAIGFTLILAGVIGVIVAIGITADSFVVYFERVRDEIREGRTIRTAVEKGWVRARRTILVADAVTAIAALLLYLLAIGRVRNFAFTLGLTTIIDLVVVFLFTKPVVTLLVRRKFFGQGHPWSGLNPEKVGRHPVAVARLGRTSTSARQRTATGEAEATADGVGSGATVLADGDESPDRGTTAGSGTRGGRR